MFVYKQFKMSDSDGPQRQFIIESGESGSNRDHTMVSFQATAEMHDKFEFLIRLALRVIGNAAQSIYQIVGILMHGVPFRCFYSKNGIHQNFSVS